MKSSNIEKRHRVPYDYDQDSRALRNRKKAKVHARKVRRAMKRDAESAINRALCDIGIEDDKTGA